MPALDERASLWLWDRFWQKPGYLVDVGAYDGTLENGSLSVRLLTRANWRGLLVEPLPASAASCREVHRFSAGVKVAEAAASDHDGRGKLYPFQTVSTLEPDWRDSCAKHFPHAHYGEPIDVRLATLKTLLDEAEAPDRIDLLKVDAEGHDLAVLKGMDWTRQPGVVIVECPNMRAAPAGNGYWSPDPAVDAYLAERGYKLGFLTPGPNAIYERVGA